MAERNFGGIRNNLNKIFDMKNMRNSCCLIFSLMMAMMWASCKKENNPTALQIQKPTVYSNDYYIKLRAYKASDHERCFVWFSDYNVKGGLSASLGERFLGLPDSVDIVSLWGGYPDPVKNPNDYKEMRFVQKTKGTKMLAVVIINIGSLPRNDQGISQYVDSLKNQVYKNDLDGLDLDVEPSDGFFTDPNNVVKLVAGLSQYLGPKSGTGKILDIDYFQNTVPQGMGPYLDFVVQQDYGDQGLASSDSNLQSDYDAVSSYIKPSQYFATENIGDLFATGGVPFTDSVGNHIYSLLGMAQWNPTQGKKGGFGAFFVQRDYYNPTPYGYLRAAIQACNPAKN